MSLRVVSLQIYPIKSCGPVALETVRLQDRGPIFDREWMIVEAGTGHFVTQRQHPELACVRPRFSRTQAPLHPCAPEKADHLAVEIPQREGGAKSLRIPLDRRHRQDSSPRQVRVWNDDCLAEDEGDEIAQALTNWIGKDVRLVRMAEAFERKLAPKYGHPDAHTGFADSQPLLLTSMESLEDLNQRLSAPVPMNRFRANIVVQNSALATAPFAEDGWKKIRIGEVEFDVNKPCSRCIMINIDQTTGDKGAEPLKTLAGYRKGEGNKVNFGQNMIHLSVGDVSVGDFVEVLENKA